METSRSRKIALAIVGTAALYGIVAGIAAPPLARKMIADRLGEKLGRVVALDELSFNPYTLDATAKGFRILEPDGRTVFASIERLDVDGSITSFHRLAPVADELTVGGLRVNLVRDGETHYNLSDILGRIAQQQAKAPADAKKAEFSVSNIRILDGRVDFDDRPKGARHGVTEINLAIPFISNLPRHLKEYVQPSFAAKVNGTPFHLKGETLPFENSLATHVALDLDAFDIPRYVAYSPTRCRSRSTPESSMRASRCASPRRRERIRPSSSPASSRCATSPSPPRSRVRSRGSIASRPTSGHSTPSAARRASPRCVSRGSRPTRTSGACRRPRRRTFASTCARRPCRSSRSPPATPRSPSSAAPTARSRIRCARSRAAGASPTAPPRRGSRRSASSRSTATRSRWPTPR
jgi:hypothetical protein